MKYIIFIIMSAVLVSCYKGESTSVNKIENNNPVDYSIFDLPPTQSYYQSEVFEDPFIKVYGIWELENITGGFHGNGDDFDFELLIVKPFGIFGLIKNGTMIKQGKITITNQLENELLVVFTADEVDDKESINLMIDPEKYIIPGDDILNLKSPCCDRYDFKFKRVMQN